MNKMTRDVDTRRMVRKFRIRKRVKGTMEKPRLVISMSAKYIYVQVVDDTTNKTILGCSTAAKKFSDTGKGGKNIAAATALGMLCAERVLGKGITRVVFDRNGYLYHGRVKAFADAAREKGLQF